MQIKEAWIKKVRKTSFFWIFFIIPALILTTSPIAGQAQQESQQETTTSQLASQAQEETTISQPQYKNTRKLWFSPFLGLFSQLSPEDFGVKPWIKPHLDFNQGFISNADLGRRQSDPAWEARVASGVTLSLPFDRFLGQVDYTYAFSAVQGRQTHANRNTHNLDALLRYDLTDKTSVGVSNNIQWSDVPLSAGRMFMLESLVAQLVHRFASRLSSDTRYTFQYFDDKTISDIFARENDFADNGVSETLNYEITKALTIGPSFAWNVRSFKEVREKDYWQISPVLDASYKLGTKTTVGGHFGWAYRKFEHASGGGHPSESELVYGATFQHLYGHKFVWNVEYDKKLSDTYDTDFVYRNDPETTPMDNFDHNFRVVKAHRIGTSATYRWTEKISSSIFGDFQFVTTDGKDNVVTGKKNNEKSMEVGTSFVYRISRLVSVNLFYSFGRRFESNDDESTSRRPYTSHRVTGGVSVQI